MRLLKFESATRLLVILAASAIGWTAANAADVTMRMRGGNFELSGKLHAYDLKTYTVDTDLYGRMSLKADRFECVSGDCPVGVVQPSVFRAPGLQEGVDLGETTWIGDSATGTTFMPTLIESFATSVGARIEKEFGADPREVSFKLFDRAGKRLGQVNIKRLGITAGFEAMAQTSADVVWSGRPIEASEEQLLAQTGASAMRSPGSEHVWANDALVVLVGKENPSVALPISTVADIFAGKVTNWAQAGFPAGAINVYAPSSDMGTWAHFENLVMKPRGLTLRSDAIRLENANEWADRVAADPLGISVSSIAFVRGARALNMEQGCGLVSPPSTFSVKTEEYPLTRRMYFYTPGEPRNPLARALLNFALSPSVQEALKASNFVDQAAEILAFTAQGSRIAYALNAEAQNYDQALMRELIQTLRGGERTSLTFRFEPASVNLDTKSREQIRVLKSLMATPAMSGKSLLLVGFSDSVGAFANNLDLSLRRSQAVRDAIDKQNALPAGEVATVGFGELAPVACNDTGEGRSLNRRVEIWVK